MKDFMALFLLSLLLSSCGNVYERQSVIYEEAVERISETKGLAMLFDNVLTAEALAAREMAILDEEEKEELDWLSEGDDALYAVLMRDSLLNITGRAVMLARTHFVEDRISLYSRAAPLYVKAESSAELDSIRGVVEKFSAMLYQDGQRLCDPPKNIRHAYDSIKGVADAAYKGTLRRVGENSRFGNIKVGGE